MNHVKTIGIDARFYGEAGPGRYAKNIVKHLEKADLHNKYIVFLREKGFAEYQPKNPNFTKVLAHYKWYSFDEQFGFLFSLLAHNLDLLYVPHFNVPVLYPKKIVCAIADIIMHTYSTEQGTTLPIWYFRFKKWTYRLVVLWVVIRSEKIIVPSLDTKNDLLKTFPFVSDSKYVLAHEGIDPDYLQRPKNTHEVLKKLNVTKPFLLYVSSFYEHKNAETFIAVFKILQYKFNFSGQIVLIGKNDKFSQKLYAKILEEKLDKNIVMPGIKRYVEDLDVTALRLEAECYVFPSLKEGFSLTPMEGQALGLSAVISNIPCHKEIYGESVLYFDPLNPNDIAEKINQVLIDKKLKANLIAKGYENVRKYSWDKTAQITLDTFNSV